jgi:hypothetical protein
MKVYKKLMDARLRLQATELTKSGHNKFAGYKYFELGDFLPTIQNIFCEIGLCGVISFTADTATLTITDTEDGSNIVLTSPMGSAALKGCHEVQNIGAVETYQRRYLWVSAMEIVEHDVLDATTGIKGTAPVVTPRGGIGDDLPEDVKDFLRDLAASVQELVGKGQAVDALAMIRQQALEADQQVWFSGQLPSNVRSALKKARDAS